ncbi:MAG: hypothetical protein Q4A54_13235 [Parabacteroides sp.]|nr:hypothetical protein [Parabacteroides sp.]
MALASGSPYYMAPANAKKMAADLCALPVWYAENKGHVLVADADQIGWMNNECPFSLDVRFLLSIPSDCDKVVPWGWSPVVLRCLKQAGVDESVLPLEKQMDQIRSLSSRRTAVDLLPSLRFPGTLGNSEWLVSVEEIAVFVKKHGSILLKAPWSGSGKGIQPLQAEPDKPMSGWIKRVITMQGGVVAEPFYAKCVDFALEFHVEENNLSFVGYSMFDTDSRGIYKGNFLQSNQAIEAYLSTFVSLELLTEIREVLLHELSSLLLGVYEGYLGVDMMICRIGENEYALHPCVEINLRVNMGVVSRLFYDRYMYPEVVGNYVVEYYPKRGEALLFHERMKSEHPLELVGGRLFRGYLSLTPVFEDTQYQVFVVV